MCKCVKFITVLLAIILLCGCAREMPYKIIEEDGKHYLSFESIPTFNYEGYVSKPTVVFDSVREMKKDIQNGNFTQEELEQIQQFGKSGDTQISIIDIGSLCELKYPNSLDLDVAWYGNTYEFWMKSKKEDLRCIAYQVSQEKWEEKIAVFDKWEMRVDEDDRSVKIYQYEDGQQQYERKYYSITDGDDILHVSEKYLVAETETMLCDMNLYGRTNGYYFYAVIYAPESGFLSERPTVEWLSQFEMKDYEEEPAWLLPVCLGGGTLLAGAGIAVLICRKKKKASVSTTEENIE